MRRIFTLLALALCCVTPARAQGPSAGQPTAEAKKFSEALKTLSATATGRQDKQKGKAKDLNDKVVERMKELFLGEADYAEEDKLEAAAAELKIWNEEARAPGIPQGELVDAIKKAHAAGNAYTGAKANSGGGKEGLKLNDDPPPTPTPADQREQPEGWGSSLSSWLSLGAMVATPLLAIGLFAFTFLTLSRTRRELGDANNMARQSLVALKNKQDALAKQLESLAASDSDLFTRLAELSAEIGAVNTRVQGLRAAPAAAPVPSSPYPSGDGAAARQPEPPSFPATAEAYLRKMQRHTTVVKPDFQNGILVADAENKGELALVQDESISHDSLFVIPRATQFQMKQDFYTYYERYYDCERPASGTVWIVDPAVVERVSGGWMLREKGVLEVR